MRLVPLSLRPVLRAAGILCLGILVPLSARAAAPGEALVIGEASYTNFPAIQACALSAHSVAAALRRIGFTVEEQEDASSGAIFAAIATLAGRLKAAPIVPVFVYVCSYATSFEDRPFVLPASAEVSRPADVLTQGILTKSLLDVVARNSKAPAVVAIDAIPTANAPSSLGLSRLADGLPTSLGLLAVRDTAAESRPTPFAALLAAALKGPTVQAAALLTDLKSQLKDGKVQIAVLHLPAEGLYLAGNPPAAATGGVSQPPAAAAPAETEAAPGPTGAGPPAATLNDEAQLTGAQRKRVQQALTNLGYYDARVDGIFGSETRAAIRRWQHEEQEPMTGHLTATQATKLLGG